MNVHLTVIGFVNPDGVTQPTEVTTAQIHNIQVRCHAELFAECEQGVRERDSYFVTEDVAVDWKTDFHVVDDTVRAGQGHGDESVLHTIEGGSSAVRGDGNKFGIQC